MVLTRVTPMMPFSDDEMTPKGSFTADRQKMTDIMAYMAMANVYGLPAMSVPAAMADMLPIGAHFMAPTGSDEVLFQLAYALEEAAPWNYCGVDIGRTE